MPELDGFAVLKRIKAVRMPVVVFTTAYDQYAVRAFAVHALDYLLKPFDEDRFTDMIPAWRIGYQRAKNVFPHGNYLRS